MSGAARHRLAAAAVRSAQAAVRLLPHAAVRAAGRRLGDLGYALDLRHRRRALVRLGEAFPDLDGAARRRLARAGFRQLGAAAADGLSARRFGLVELCRRLSIEGWEHLHEAEAAGRGLLVLTGHLGFWEVAVWAVGTYAGPVHAARRPFANPYLAAEHARTAERFGVRPLAEGVDGPMVAAIEVGEKVAAVIDRRPPPGAEQVAVPFCGRPLEASPAAARAALRAGAPAVPVFALPAPGGRYRLVVRPPILPPAATGVEPSDEAVAALTARYLGALEAEVRRRPELWPWGC